MSHKITRRRFVSITAAAGGLSLLPFGHRPEAQAPVVRWQGTALGATATMQIHHPDRPAAERLVERSLAEVRRLERLFSLYREDSALVALNRRGALEAPPVELVELLGESRCYAALTDGAFDPTVQVLWTLYADHFAKPEANPEGPPAAELDAALAKVGFSHVLVSRDRIAFAQPGMALTLNGIAQGYITDRVVDILRAGGITHSLVDMGETRALDARPDGQPWEVGLSDPDDPKRITATVPLTDQAIATSGGYGFRFDDDGRFNHLFDPRTGRCAKRYSSVTVVMPTATAADALSTAFSFLPAENITVALKKLGYGQTHLMTSDGRRMTLAA